MSIDKWDDFKISSSHFLQNVIEHKFFGVTPYNILIFWVNLNLKNSSVDLMHSGLMEKIFNILYLTLNLGSETWCYWSNIHF